MSKSQAKRIAIYGKGGIGKSTTTSNISAALATAGYRTMQIGCDPKSDSTNTLRGGKYIPTMLDTLFEGRKIKTDEVVFEGFAGVYCVESGGPSPGVGCAGRGIIAAVQTLEQLRVFEELELDYVLFDVLGDVVCGGFATPIREGLADCVYTVSSADFMSIYAANNLFKGIQKYSKSGGALLGGMIANSINTPHDKQIVDDFCELTATTVMGYIPRSVTVAQSELQGKTTIEAAPLSDQAKTYVEISERIAAHADFTVPAPLGIQELRSWAGGWAERLLAVGDGVEDTGVSVLV